MVSSSSEGSRWSAAVERSVRALSMNSTRPPGFSAEATISQNAAKRSCGTWESQKAKTQAS